MPAPDSAFPFSREDVQRAYDPLTFHRGSRYLRDDRVVQSDVDADAQGQLRLRGRVAGSAVYGVQVLVHCAGPRVRISSRCDCPVHTNCKHGVALCLHALEHAQQSGHDPEQLARGQLQHWLQVAAAAQPSPGAAPTRSKTQRRDTLHYLLHGSRVGAEDRYAVAASIKVVRSRPRKSGKGYLKPQPAASNDIPTLLEQGALGVQDMQALGMLVLGSAQFGPLHAPLDAVSGVSLLQMLSDTQRLHWESLDGPTLQRGPARQLQTGWALEDGVYQLQLSCTPAAHLLHGALPLFVDPASGEWGSLESEPRLTSAIWLQLCRVPPIPESLSAEFGQTLRMRLPHWPLPPPQPIAEEHLRAVQPRPVVRLRAGADTGSGNRLLDLQFSYAEHSINPRRPEAVLPLPMADQLLFVHRDLEAERRLSEQLVALGWRAQASDVPAFRFTPRADTASGALQIWHRLLEQERPQLEAQGWQFIAEADLGLQFIDADWDAALDEGQDWFDLRFDLEVDGTKVALAPLLAPLVGEWLDIPERHWPDRLAVDLGDGRQVLLDSQRLQPILRTLAELFALGEADKAGQIRVPRSQASLLAALDQARALKGASELRQMLRALGDQTQIAEVPVSPNLQAELRPYQQAGLSWLQFLRRARFSGILADDMGLGKTLQTLAHIQCEKDAGRLTEPALIICPTSLLGNWRREAARFTPDLRVLTLQGPQRQTLMPQIAAHDIVLSTYPLLSRDEEELRVHEWHLLILDEAQQVKNPQSRAARVLRRLRSRHRLCLTGTPMENHLGELWTQFDFLMPGLLGELPRFNNRFRRPIEVDGDATAHAQLVQLVRPFMLRRTKSQVATELPPRTEIIHGVTLEPAQAQLYESVRVAMDHKVRDAISRQGVERSHITILDALLKLRQVCCDPALLALDAARKVQASAKRERLRELLPEMLEEGRRVLIFSQFTKMLELIEQDLKSLQIPWTKLTGQTRDRDAAIQAFRDGEVDVFLISLKAGGVGLNLVEADTVILYDPWWNPAVEDQAADRAHRIGQDKPVFIHRLVVDNSVEERMLQLQQRKEALAEGVYAAASGSGPAERITPFDPGTLAELLSPLSVD